jgi:hypothetical protein
MGEAGFDGEPLLPKEKDITFADDCYGSNLATEFTENDTGGGVVNFHELSYGPANQTHGGEAIIELTAPDGSVSQVAIITTGIDLDIDVPDFGDDGTPYVDKGHTTANTNIVQEVNVVVGNIEAEREAVGDPAIATYVVAPNGEVVHGNGPILPAPATFGAPYKLFDDLGARADQPGVKNPDKFAAFKGLGNVTRVIIDRRKSIPHSGGHDEASKNPFSGKIKNVRRDIKQRAAASS